MAKKKGITQCTYKLVERGEGQGFNYTKVLCTNIMSLNVCMDLIPMSIRKKFKVSFYH